ncbi:MAG: PPC domain-containing protein [Anaerolineae bacterium]|nr:PPC domain-containing protein [Anaerolineae bacterium]
MDDFLRFLRHSAKILFCACVLWLSSVSAQAQTLTLNASQSGELAVGASDSWSFIAQEGQILSFTMTSDTLDSVIAIQDLNGNTLISNDDYHYPESRDALIEAFSAPYTGSYILLVSGFGESSGAYDLLMLSGYSQIVAQDSFDTNSGWQTVDVGSESLPELEIATGTLMLSQEGINQRALAVGVRPTSPVYAFQARFMRVSGGQGWRVGLLFQYEDALNYYAVLLNHNGAWRMLRVQAGEETILRDWGTHPAIRPSATEFTLGVLVNGTGYDIFYNEQFIGTQVDAALSDGQVGFVINTVDAIGSTVTARIDDMIITAPMSLNGENLFPDTLVALNNTYTARELERRLIIPTGGVMALHIPESFAQQVSAGVSRFPLARESQFANFVLGATVSWQASSADLNGCGLIVRAADNLDYVLGYVDSMGGYGLSVRRDDTFTENIFNDNLAVIRQAYQLLLIAVDDVVLFYLDGTFVGAVDSEISSGGIAEAVVNFEATNTECRYTNLWVWTWD